MALNLHSKLISLQSFFCFELFICFPFVDFTPWTPKRALPWIHCGTYGISRIPPAFYTIQKLNLCWKMDISKTAWINACLHEWTFLWALSQKLITWAKCLTLTIQKPLGKLTNVSHLPSQIYAKIPSGI